MNDLLRELRQLEVELHQAESRRNKSRLLELLHPDFVELGRSGRRFSRDQIISELTAEPEIPAVVPLDFELIEIGDGAAILMYVSAHESESGELIRRTNRSSIWVRSDLGWQVLFHQGTPVDG